MIPGIEKVWDSKSLRRGCVNLAKHDICTAFTPVDINIIFFGLHSGCVRIKKYIVYIIFLGLHCTTFCTHVFPSFLEISAQKWVIFPTGLPRGGRLVYFLDKTIFEWFLVNFEEMNRAVFFYPFWVVLLHIYIIFLGFTQGLCILT